MVIEGFHFGRQSVDVHPIGGKGDLHRDNKGDFIQAFPFALLLCIRFIPVTRRLPFIDPVFLVTGISSRQPQIAVNPEMGLLILDFHVGVQIQFNQRLDPRLLRMQADLFRYVKPELLVFAIHQRKSLPFHR